MKTTLLALLVAGAALAACGVDSTPQSTGATAVTPEKVPEAKPETAASTDGEKKPQ